MKNIAVLLNTREFKSFEEGYQFMKSVPGWIMSNVFTPGTIESHSCTDEPVYFPTGSKDKSNRLTIAMHEAGHAITLAATYRFVGEVRIDVVGHPKGWLGWVKPKGHDDVTDDKPKEQNESMPCKPLIKLDLLLTAAGFVGESFAGKKVGANHEKFDVYIKCRILDDQEGVEPLTNWKHYVEWCRKIILNNETLFWRITDDLLANSHMTESVKVLLHNDVRKEKPELLLY